MEYGDFYRGIDPIRLITFGFSTIVFMIEKVDSDYLSDVQSI